MLFYSFSRQVFRCHTTFDHSHVVGAPWGKLGMIRSAALNKAIQEHAVRVRGWRHTMALDSQNSAIGDGAPGRAVETTAKRPKRWKQFCITVAGVYPLTVVIPITLTWLSHFLAPLRGVRDQRGGFGNAASDLPVVHDPSSLQARLPTLASELKLRAFILGASKRGHQRDGFLRS
jgi:hypothetical protein